VDPSSHAARGGPFHSALVLADGGKPAARVLLDELRPWLAERLERVDVVGDVHAFGPADARAARRPDLVLVLGGDGSILAAVRAFAEAPVPTLGINLGRVGFLASAQNTEWRDALGEVLAGNGVLESRMRLAVRKCPRGGEPGAQAVALNDVVLARGATQGMMTVALTVGGSWVTNYRADGLIVATPSGSTAYSLASGGPVLAPAMQGIVVTPISPQALAHRPIVLDTEAELSLELMQATGPADLVVDGWPVGTLEPRDVVSVQRHPVPYPLLSPPGLDAFKRLRDRLGWRGTLEKDASRDGPGAAGRG
jgi:NAD+ kinase